MALDHAWDRALALCWDSYLADTTPVGAVVVDESGEVVAEGRGRRFDSAGPGRQLSWCHIAHAEVNALALLPPTRHYEDHILLTTLEPCCMCFGAAVQTTVTQLRYAGRDPYGGAASMQIDTPQARRRPIAVSGPLSDDRGRFAELLHIRWLADIGATAVLEVQSRALPEIHELAVRSDVAELLTAMRSRAARADEVRAAVRELAPAL